MNNLLEKLIAAREQWIVAGKFELCLRRPTQEQLARMARGNVDWMLEAKRAVVNWRGVRECDLLPAESDQPAVFEAELFDEWFGDQFELWKPVIDAFKEAISAATDKEAAQAKN